MCHLDHNRKFLTKVIGGVIWILMSLEAARTPNESNPNPKTQLSSTGRPVCGQESTKRCVLTPGHVKKIKKVRGDPYWWIKKRSRKLLFRVSGLSHAVVKEAEHLRVQELVNRIENHHHREALHTDLQQSNVYNPIQQQFEGDDPRIGQCGVTRVVRNYIKSTMFSLSSLLESRTCVLHLWTMLD